MMRITRKPFARVTLTRRWVRQTERAYGVTFARGCRVSSAGGGDA
jgi:hypothetical protein